MRKGEQATIGSGGRGWEGLWLGACPGSLLFKRSRRLAARQAGLEGGLQREALRFSRLRAAFYGALCSGLPAFRGSGHWAAWVSLVDTCRVNLFGGLLLYCVWTFHLPASGGA